MAKKRASQAPVLFVYVVTMLVCLAIFGSAAVVLLDVFVTQPREQREREQQQQENKNEVVIEEVDYTQNRRTILFVGAEGENVNGIVLLRIMPDTYSIKLVPVSTRTVAVIGSSTETIATHFKSGGMNYLKSAVEDTFDIKCDKYIKISNEGFNRLVEYFGGTSSYAFPQDLYYKDEITGELTSFTHGQATRTLWGDDIRKIVTYPLYEGGDETATQVLGEISTSLINGACYTYKDNIINNMQNIFNTIFNNSDTDITSQDFKEQRDAYEHLVENAGLAVCSYRMPGGSWDVRGNFNIDEAFKAELKEYFELTVTE
ncbi:MAG: LCP family protein [Oscillospiraceae bacterium]|nr:LCP family protein [Oscillospiraceae bacterium]